MLGSCSQTDFADEMPSCSTLVRRRSLVEDARIESARNRSEKNRMVRDRKDEEDILAEEILCRYPGGDEPISTCLTFSLRRNLLKDLPLLLDAFQRHNSEVLHLETRSSGKDVFASVLISRKNLLGLIRSTRNFSVVLPDERMTTVIWFPRHISDLDKCSRLQAKLELDLDINHPGFRDIPYRARRTEIVRIASNYKQGDAIPRVDYTDEEIKTWGTVFVKLRSLYSVHACSTYLTAFRLLEESCGYRPDAIPQLQDVSTFLKRRSGFELRPAAGLVSARDFLSSLAFRVFQCTQYVRHSSCPHHTPEPDCIHELLGHAPMLADPQFARFSQEIGLASLGASDRDIERLSTVYWFTVEFGLCKEGGSVKAYGAGLLSSFGELQHALSERPRLLPFDPESTCIQPYQDQDFQDVYFVAESFQDATEKIRRYVRDHIVRQFDLLYDPYTETVSEVNSLRRVEDGLREIGDGCLRLGDAVGRLRREDSHQFSGPSTSECNI